MYLVFMQYKEEAKEKTLVHCFAFLFLHLRLVSPSQIQNKNCDPSSSEWAVLYGLYPGQLRNLLFYYTVILRMLRDSELLYSGNLVPDM